MNTRTYHVVNSITVKSPAVLTIEPGTQILVDPGKFIKIEGTLVADGSAEAPIVFTASSPTTGQEWLGIYFTEFAIPATFNPDDSFLSGSILRHVEVSYADIGANIQTQAPYFSNDLFHHNGTGINQSGLASTRIETSVFTENTSPGIHHSRRKSADRGKCIYLEPIWNSF